MTNIDQGAHAHKLAAQIVEDWGEKVALATARGICERLGVEPVSSLHRLEDSLLRFDAVRHAGSLDIPTSDVRKTVTHLEFLRETGLAICKLVVARRQRGRVYP